MSRQKNLKKRNEILSSSFKLFSKKAYNDVTMNDIAVSASISKSLLQYYFQQKKNIVGNMLTDLLEKSFEYVDYNLASTTEIYVKLSVYANLFFSVILEQDDLRRFINNVIRNENLLDLWINIVNDWLESMNDKYFKKNLNDRYLIALTFSMGGGSNLLSKYELEVSGSYIAQQMVSSFINILDDSNSEIGQIIKQSNKLIKKIDIKDFERYYQKEVLWYGNREQ
ncbi:TetR/AcrR family transcriptional regulator (plasmid) [Clostridium estertheticum]|uniref:TetR/AcrR family transcriptional regulator n=1 Tax=Clostridium estertheticum TaxID=238834 RepID=UPI001C0BD247|nr:TetR/AcrR family transcriptional regulator [Clostridium estertheticum]MBU3217354.1 TetR/AcrR family transcriptional regulator [Clostridium estertheticum]WAG58129.1 TetR/AcrR family transcriptional regulator [Clostridium estertheticum]